MPNAAERWVFDASPLIVLAKAGRLTLVEDAKIERIVPEAVARELVAGPAGDPARVAIEQGWGIRLSDQPIPQTVLEWSLGAGDLALEPPAASEPPTPASKPYRMASVSDGRGSVQFMRTLDELLKALRCILATEVKIIKGPHPVNQVGSSWEAIRRNMDRARGSCGAYGNGVAMEITAAEFEALKIAGAAEEHDHHKLDWEQYERVLRERLQA